MQLLYSAIGAKQDTGFFEVSLFGAVGDGVTDDTAAIQAAIDAAALVGGAVLLESKRYRITSPLEISVGITFQGCGVVAVPGLAADNPGASIASPSAPPYFRGSVLLMTAAATNAINITVAGDSVHLRDFGILFDEAIKFTNTGHGVYQMPPDNLIDGVGTFKDNGPTNNEWRNVFVYGHDGDHYAFYNCNSIESVFSNLTSTGGGGFCHENNGYQTGNADSYNQITGNVILSNCNFYTVTGGTAHVVHIKRTQGTPSHFTFIRTQGLTMSHTLFGAPSTPTSAQKLLKADNGVNFLQWFQCGWESLHGGGDPSKIDITEETRGFFCTPTSVVGDQPFAERGREISGVGFTPIVSCSPLSFSWNWGNNQKLIRINEPNGDSFRRGFYSSTPSSSADHFSGWYVTDYGDNKDYSKWGHGELDTTGTIYTWNQWVSQKGNQWCRGWIDGGSRYYAQLASNQNVATTTLTEVTGMSFTLPAGTFELTGLWTFSNSASGTGAKLEIEFSQAVDATWKISSVPDSGAQTPSFNFYSDAAKTAIGGVQQATAQYPSFELHRARITTPSSTTVTVKFAQSTSDGGINTTMMFGSYIEARRLI